MILQMIKFCQPKIAEILHSVSFRNNRAQNKMPTIQVLDYLPLWNREMMGHRKKVHSTNRITKKSHSAKHQTKAWRDKIQY